MYFQFNGIGSSILPPNPFMMPGQFFALVQWTIQAGTSLRRYLVIKDNNVVTWIANNERPYSLILAGSRVTDVSFFVSNSGFLYDAHRRRKWVAEASHTRDKSVWMNSHLTIQDDGNMVIYDNRNGNLCRARFGFVPNREKKKIVREYGPYTIATWRF